MNKINLKNKGFTLIELLVVVAIIGVLASVVLASLNTARAKGANAAIKANMANIRAQAELVYDSLSPNGYGTVANASSCTGPTASSLFATTVPNTAVINAAVTAAIAAAGSTATSWCSSTIGSSSAWAASISLKVAEGSNTHWCVDSTGVSKGETAVLSSGQVCQ
jgi:prepilin-type N-terminal cleavage/methylation domain-containing protein